MAPAPEEVSMPRCPESGQGCHIWLYKVVKLWVKAGNEDEFIEKWAAHWMSRPETPGEIKSTIRKARYEEYNNVVPPRGFSRNRPLNGKLIETLSAEPTEIGEFLGRSPVDCRTISAGGVLRTLFAHDERTIIFTEERSQGQLIWHHGVPDLAIGKAILGNQHGAWFLINPVSGKFEKIERLGRFSRRSEENTTSYRHILIESDAIKLESWLSILKTLPLPIVSVTLSGNESAHALVRVNSKSRDHWVKAAEAIADMVVPLGACPGALTAVRLSRLPKVVRADTEQEQKLIWLNPNPSTTPIQKFFKTR
jgi:hypothetical protein